jgi:ParB family transcriptional regulator, chromosome partitioning protein
MWEITENLHRADLTVLERNEQTAEWLRLADEEEAESAELKLGQVGPVSVGGRGKEGGIRAAARDMGVEHKKAQRAVKIDAHGPCPLSLSSIAAGASLLAGL